MATILQVDQEEEGGESRVRCCACAFQNSYVAGIMLAMIGRMILEAIRLEAHGNPGLMEQAMADMATAFVKDMALSSDSPKMTPDNPRG